MPTIPRLQEIEIQVLREIAEAGSQDVVWGGGMTLAIESLRNRGLTTRSHEPDLTDLGKHVLEGLRNE